MARFPRAFSEMAINMVRAGGEGGFLEDALDRVATFTEQQEDLKGRTISALAYPLLLGSAGTIVVTVLIIFFVPKFAVMFERLRERGELPWATDMLLWVSDTSAQLRLMLIVAAGDRRSGSSSTSGCKTPEGRRLADLVRIKVPVAGPIFLSFAVARFCRVLGTLLHNGVPILKGPGDQPRRHGQPRAVGGDRQGLGEHLVRPVAGRAAGRERAFPENGGRDDRRRRGIEHARHGAGRTSPTTWKNAPAGSSTCSSGCWSRSC